MLDGMANPIPGAAPMVAGTFDLAARGYVEEEFFLAGNAVAYDGDPSGDGQWEAKPVSSEPFTTRLIVRRPASTDSFSLTLIGPRVDIRFTWRQGNCHRTSDFRFWTVAVSLRSE